MRLDSECVKLLWTGGWDSTFQLLRLLLTEKRAVIPFYLIDAERPSTGKELQTTKRIKERLFKEYPHTRELLKPTQYASAADVAPDEEITSEFESIREENHLGKQYDWLARFCKEYGIFGMQLCVHDQDHAKLVLQLRSLKQSKTAGGGMEPDSNDIMFRWFSFPVLEFSKLQMAEISKQNGWEKIMNMTWFCHTPKKNGTPCGKCPPCRYTIEEGMSWRIPPENLKAPSRLRPLKTLAKRGLSLLKLAR